MHLITFASARFDPAAEPENPINPIPGHAVLHWLAESLRAAGYDAGAPDAEDWGWYISVVGADGRYIVGAGGEPLEESPGQMHWMVQVHRSRSLADKVLRRNLLGADDALSAAVERIIRQDAASRDVVAER